MTLESKTAGSSADGIEQVCRSLGMESAFFSEFMKREDDLARRFDLNVRWNASSLEFALAKYFSERHATLRILSAILHHEVLYY